MREREAITKKNFFEREREKKSEGERRKCPKMKTEEKIIIELVFVGIEKFLLVSMWLKVVDRRNFSWIKLFIPLLLLSLIIITMNEAFFLMHSLYTEFGSVRLVWFTFGFTLYSSFSILLIVMGCRVVDFPSFNWFNLFKQQSPHKYLAHKHTPNKIVVVIMVITIII